MARARPDCVLGQALDCRCDRADCAVAPRCPRQDINFRSFGASAAIGPPAEAFAAKLENVTKTVLGAAGTIHFVKLAGTPAVPKQFSDIIAAVAAGQSGGGFDAAYSSGSELNKTWGFIYNSGVPFGPTFDEFVGFLYGKSVDNGQKTGQDLVQESSMPAAARRHDPDRRQPRAAVRLLLEPLDNVPGRRVGLAGLCGRRGSYATCRPANVLNLACDDLVATHKIRPRTSASSGRPGRRLARRPVAKTLHGFEFATPLDDVSQLFKAKTTSAAHRYVHTPGWQQQFLITWIIINKAVWSALTPAQQMLIQTALSTSSRRTPRTCASGAALQSSWRPTRATVPRTTIWSCPHHCDPAARCHHPLLNARADDQALPADDRADCVKILDALRLYVHASNAYRTTAGSPPPRLRTGRLAWATAGSRSASRRASRGRRPYRQPRCHRSHPGRDLQIRRGRTVFHPARWYSRD
jgi:hypothetical protein